MKNRIEPYLLSKKEMLAFLSISSTTTLDKYVKEGIIPKPTVHLGKYPRWHREVVTNFFPLDGQANQTTNS